MPGYCCCCSKLASAADQKSDSAPRFGGGLLHLAISGINMGVLRFCAAAGTGVAAGDHPGFSSTVLAAKSLRKRAELRAFHGRAAIGILIIQDLAALVADDGGGRWVRRHCGRCWCWIAVAAAAGDEIALDRSGHDGTTLATVCGLARWCCWWKVGGLGSRASGPEFGVTTPLTGGLLAKSFPERLGNLKDAMVALKEVLLVGFSCKSA